MHIDLSSIVENAIQMESEMIINLDVSVKIQEKMGIKMNYVCNSRTYSYTNDKYPNKCYWQSARTIPIEMALTKTFPTRILLQQILVKKGNMENKQFTYFTHNFINHHITINIIIIYCCFIKH